MNKSFETFNRWGDLSGYPEARRAVVGYLIRVIFLAAVLYAIARGCGTAVQCRRDSKYPNTLQHDINSEWDCEPDNSKN